MNNGGIEEVAFQSAVWHDTKKADNKFLSRMGEGGILLGFNTELSEQLGGLRKLDIKK